MAFPLYFLEQLRERINIVDLISRSVRLQRRGSEWIGLCPFHPEKTPSFHVVPDKQFYHCFGCGAHGDGLKFLREHHNLPFLEAVKELAEMAGLEMPARDPKRQKQEDTREKLVGIMDRAAAWFHQQLFAAAGAEARAMLAARGIDEAMMVQFQIGYAPDHAQSLIQALQLPSTEARNLGLIKTGERGDYGFFRGRLMFPIRDVRGHTIAFGGRRMREDQPAKYMNSPDSPLFTKRQQLYNLDQAKTPARKGQDLLVAEGYMDVIALVQAGFSAAIAPLGTALTAEQLQRIWQYHDRPVLCLDGDSAGQKAALRVAHAAIQVVGAGKGLRFAVLPAGEDPDSLIRARGQGAMAECIAGALNLGEFLWQGVSRGINFQQPEAVSALKQQCDALAGQCGDPYLRSSYRQFWRDQIWQGQRGATQKKYTSGKPAQGAGGNAVPRSEAGHTRIRIILAALLRYPELIEEFAEHFRDIVFPEHLDKLYQKLHLYPADGAHPTEDTMQGLSRWLDAPDLETVRKQVLSREVFLVAPEVGPSGTVEQARALLERLSKLCYEQRLIADGQRLYQEATSNPEAAHRLRLLQQEIQELRRSEESLG